MTENSRLSFQASIARTISLHLQDHLGSEFFDAHDALEPLFKIYGTQLDESDLKRLSRDELIRISQEYNQYFEVKTIDPPRVVGFLKEALMTWKGLEIETF